MAQALFTEMPKRGLLGNGGHVHICTAPNVRESGAYRWGKQPGALLREPIEGIGGERERRRVGHQVVGRYCRGLMSQGDNGSVKASE